MEYLLQEEATQTAQATLERSTHVVLVLALVVGDLTVVQLSMAYLVALQELIQVELTMGPATVH